MLSNKSHSDADDDDDTEAPDDNTQHQNDDDTSDDAGRPTPTTVSADAAAVLTVDFCEVCLVAPRDTRIRVNLCFKITLRRAVTKNNIRHLNIMLITVLDHECHEIVILYSLYIHHKIW